MPAAGLGLEDNIWVSLILGTTLCIEICGSSLSQLQRAGQPTHIHGSHYPGTVEGEGVWEQYVDI